ncbi:hypothetical protein KL930_002766 [Ogataea haglerorum]|uniref:DNA replication regulator Sld3 C-terminal domain-containing protein n=1 Tax=Ogataea haglerorum TaxID=1937702 RepID=A0AAN6D7G3_9ASCO|nr:hypothetical protein KL950_005008 [Ogataea haglerorum]KAG7703029.1 hypothetical protein KL914_005034 [Ogataea haglerorum]KAG7728220.1 hypothetical protein KL933_002346 [Ogataea haglerorum]KAG7731610.1 hypothetical protein KL948_003240 [Ogataea haglerorum]KAG7734303.1 hypothetical protein KL932_004978 [Ogataea haglerorum]
MEHSYSSHISQPLLRFRVVHVKGIDRNPTETLVEVVCAITTVNAELGFFKIQSSLDLIFGAALLESFNSFKIRNEYSSVFVVIHSSNQDLASKPAFGILSPGIQHNIWTLYKLVDGAHIEERILRNHSGNPLLPETPTSCYHFPKIKKSGLAIKVSACRLSLCMTPPSIKLSAGLNSPSKLSQVDPRAFLSERYFSTLYQSTVPLQFFAKTALPRVHVLSHSNIQLARETISSFIIRSMTSLYQRFDFSPSSCTPSLNLLNDDELRYRVEFLRNYSGKSEDQFRESLDNLRLREAKLQIILSLDLLRLLDCGRDNQKPTLRKSRITYAKQSLVGRKKRLIPTLVGTAIPDHARFTTDLKNILDNSTNELTSNLLMTNINALMDKLCVHDAIKGLSLIEEDSTYRFLVSSVAPFFQKYHPKLLRELIKKSRGPSASRKSGDSHEEHSKSIHSPPPKYSGTSQSDTSILGDSLVFSNLKLKRKASNLGVTKNLSRKTFDMVKSTSITQQLSTSQAGIESQSRLQIQANSSNTRISTVSAFETSAIFSHRKRNTASKHIDNSEGQAISYTEVEATPVKKPRASLEIFASPDDHTTTVNDVSPIKTSKISDTRVTAAPLKVHKEANENIVHTSENTPTASITSCTEQTLPIAETSMGNFANEIPENLVPYISRQSCLLLPPSSPKDKSTAQGLSETLDAKEHSNTKRKLIFD